MTRTCKHCHAPIVRKVFASGNLENADGPHIRQWCSRVCYDAYRMENPKPRPLRERSTIKLVPSLLANCCQSCGHDNPSAGKADKPSHCRICGATLVTKIEVPRYFDIERKKIPAVASAKACARCGVAFGPTRFKNGVTENQKRFAKRQYCSPDCAAKAVAESRRIPKNTMERRRHG